MFYFRVLLSNFTKFESQFAYTGIFGSILLLKVIQLIPYKDFI